jgi:uncharacterized coiled-coil protein SlyX
MEVTKPKVKTKSQVVLGERAKANVQRVARITPETAIKSLATMKLGFSGVLDDIGNKMTGQLAELKEVTEAIATQKAELEALHGIKVEADTLQDLKGKQDEVRQSWVLEQESHHRNNAQRDADLVTARQREQDSYLYAQRKSQQEQTDKFNANLTVARADFDVVKRDFLASMSLREEALTKREEIVKALEGKHAGLEASHKGDVDKAVAIATNSLKKDLENKFALEKMGYENTKNLQTAEIASLKAQVAGSNFTIDSLNTRLAAAVDKVQDIANKAIEGASKQAVHVHSASQEPTGKGR